MPELTPVLVDAPTLRGRIHRKVTEALQTIFPIDLKGRTIELKDVRVHAKDYSPLDQYHANMTGGTLEEPVKGTLVLKDAGGNVLDEAPNFTLAHVPYFTERHTVVNKGNEYQIANMLRRKPGVYTQRGENDRLHTTFNLSRGKNLDLSIDGEKGTFYLTPAGTSTNIPLYPVLRALGLPHADVAKAWGKGVADVNAAHYGAQPKIETAVAKLYAKLVHPALFNPAATHDAKVEAIKEKWRNTTMDGEVVARTLGERHDNVSAPALLAAARRVLRVHEGKEDVDDADSLEFKTFHSVDDYLAENVKLVGREWKKKLPFVMRGKDKLRDGIKAAPFSDGIRKFITTSSLTAVPTGINPIELIDHAVKVTALGEGGIPSERAIPYEARMTHATHYGTLDPIRTPESGHAGVDIRASIAAHRDDHGNLYTPVYNVKTRGADFLKAGDLLKHVVAFPHQELTGEVDAFVNGRVQRVAASRVDYQIPHEMHALSPATSLIPFLRSIQGNRAIMGSKMQTQGLPLLAREAPLVQVKSHLDEHSMEHHLGRMIVPVAPIDGTVAKIENGFIYIRPHGTKTAEDRPVIDTRKLGPFTFNIELRKGGPDSSGTWRGPTADYGHLPGYRGPDGDSLDFFMGHDHRGSLFAYDKQRNDDGAGWKTTDVKFVVGLTPDEEKAFHANVAAFKRPETRFANLRHFADWSALKSHIDAHYADTAKTAALPKTPDLPRDASEGGLVKVPFSDHFPFPSKTFLHHTLEVKPGDAVTAGQRLADSNFTRGGTLATGTNLRVGYMAYRGLNSNDAVVISEGAAEKLTSEHMYREVYPIAAGAELTTARHKAYFGPKYAPAQYAKLGDDGVVKKGARVDPHDLLVAALAPNPLKGADLILGKISKALTRPYRDLALTWDHGTPGEVVDVVRTDKQIAILVKTREKMQVGDKLAGRYGNKGVVARIVPDAEMIQDASGKPLDLLMTSTGVVSRINPAQIVETAVAKVARKTGKPLVYDNARAGSVVQWAKDLLKEHGLTDKEHVYDPVAKRTLTGPDGKGVMTGEQYIFKLFKSTETNFAGHAVGPYDLNEQPLKVGGDDSAKSIGKMELDALLAHNARNIVREAATIRGQRNDEFWRAIQLGLPLPAPKPSFAFRKFVGMLEGAGVKVDKRDAKFKLLPLTDADIAARSHGKIENGKTVTAKNLRPEAGGLFDTRLTGGPQGTHFAHIDLPEPVVNPVFEEPVRRLLGMTEKAFLDAHKEKGGRWFKQQLAALDVPARLRDLRARLPKASGAVLNDVVKQIKYLEALQAESLAPHDAYVLSKVPVVPPLFRPIAPDPSDPNRLMVADANKLYAHLLDANHVLRSTVLPSDLPAHRGALYNAVGAVFGTHDVENDELKGQSVKGFIRAIAGRGSPKGGFFQRKLMSRTQDVSGRGTAVPDGNLAMDQVGIPEEMLWKMWDKLLVARLVRSGYDALAAREHVDKRTPAARDALAHEIRERPVMINRAPTLHRWGLIAARPVPVQGKTIRVNPFIEQGMNLDYDGDTLQVHSPVTAEGIADAKLMTMPHLLLSDQQRDKLVAFPQHEAIIGITHASTTAATAKPVRTFADRDAVLAAYRRGELHLGDQIEVPAAKHASADGDDVPDAPYVPDTAWLTPPEHVIGAAE